MQQISSLLICHSLHSSGEKQIIPTVAASLFAQPGKERVFATSSCLGPQQGGCLFRVIGEPSIMRLDYCCFFAVVSLLATATSLLAGAASVAIEAPHTTKAICGLNFVRSPLK